METCGDILHDAAPVEFTARMACKPNGEIMHAPHLSTGRAASPSLAHLARYLLAAICKEPFHTAQ